MSSLRTPPGIQSPADAARILSNALAECTYACAQAIALADDPASCEASVEELAQCVDVIVEAVAARDRFGATPPRATAVAEAGAALLCVVVAARTDRDVRRHVWLAIATTIAATGAVAELNPHSFEAAVTAIRDRTG